MSKSAWASRRQAVYGTGVVLLFIAITIPIAYSIIHEPPTCFDGKKNQGETAVDRGGPCQKLDERTIQPHAVLWSRAFPVRDGFYNAVAYVENPNQEAGVFEAAYQFKLYDERNLLVAERFGRTPVFPGKVFPVFESRIDIGNRAPVRALFSFVNDFEWNRAKDPTDVLTVFNERASELDSNPRIDAILRNDAVNAREDIVVVATLFDANGNAIAASRTLVERIEPNQEKKIAFTWPEPFGVDVARIDVIPLARPEPITVE